LPWSQSIVRIRNRFEASKVNRCNHSDVCHISMRHSQTISSWASNCQKEWCLVVLVWWTNPTGRSMSVERAQSFGLHGVPHRLR
jgi:hypothetical protein